MHLLHRMRLWLWGHLLHRLWLMLAIKSTMLVDRASLTLNGLILLLRWLSLLKLTLIECLLL